MVHAAELGLEVVHCLGCIVMHAHSSFLQITYNLKRIESQSKIPAPLQRFVKRAWESASENRKAVAADLGPELVGDRKSQALDHIAGQKLHLPLSTGGCPRAAMS
eukprot:5883922-Pleurochrysis_carterae.AAC.1